jgi:hypothetical protein
MMPNAERVEPILSGHGQRLPDSKIPVKNNAMNASMSSKSRIRGVPWGQGVIHLVFNSAFDTLMSRMIFYEGKICGEFKTWGKLMECRQGRGEKK